MPMATETSNTVTSEKAIQVPRNVGMVSMPPTCDLSATEDASMLNRLGALIYIFLFGLVSLEAKFLCKAVKKRRV